MDKNIWIYAHWNVYSKTVEYQTSNYERGVSDGDLLIEKRVLTFDTPNDKELRVNLAKSLQDRLYHIRGEHSKQELDEQENINEFLSLEHKPLKQENTDDDIPF